MANNLIQIKRTSIPGRAANTTTLPNPGELAINMTDGILYSGNGSFIFEIGANNTNVNVSGNLTVKSVVANGSVGGSGTVLTSDGNNVYWGPGAAGYTGSKGDLGFTGSKGDIGFTGSQGANGFDGSKGDVGYTGSSGNDGFTGSKGDAGFTGSQGSTGFTGSKGDTGFTGSAGAGIDVGSNNQIIYRDSSNNLTGSSNFIYDGVSIKVNGNLESVYHNGDEGGEIFLQKPDTNTTLAAGITIDVFRNKVRFFENGGTNRGAFIDITAAASGVGTDLLASGTGYTGSKGDLGYTGSAGTSGTSGYNGSTGFTGSAGTNGTTGFTGSAGFIGSKGDTGFTGSVGFVGSLGFTGSLGYSGSFGYTGSLGFTGSIGVGYTGSSGTGTVGYTGSIGATGFTGSAGGGGGGASVSVSDTAPVSPSAGNLWWNSTTGTAYIYYNDGDSSQWVELSPKAVGYTGSEGAKVILTETPPASPVPGNLWWNSNTGITFIYYDDGTSSQWVEMNPPAASSESFVGMFLLGGM